MRISTQPKNEFHIERSLLFIFKNIHSYLDIGDGIELYDIEIEDDV